MEQNPAHSSPKLPPWLESPEGYSPTRDSDRFLAKSTLGLMGVLSRFRLQDGTGGRFEPAPLLKLFALVIVILLVSLADNYAFVLCVLALILVRMCLLPSTALKEAAVTAALAALLTLLIMVPAVLLGQMHSFIVLPTKVFVSVACALIVSSTTPFNQLTASLRKLHVPNLFILTIDLTLKYIVMLGQVALETLTALRCRSVGKNRDKKAGLGGVIGVTFVKSQELSVDTYAAMTCRGFTGEYSARVPHGAMGPAQKGSTVLSILGLAALIALFLLLEGVIPW